VDSSIARNAPQWAQTFILAPLFKLCFKPPLTAALAILRLLSMPASRTGSTRYFHMYKEKPAREDAADPAVGARLWAESEALLKTVVCGRK
jgi:hypothetical protein